MNGGFAFASTPGWASNAVPIVVVAGRVVEVLRVATIGGGGPRWFGASGLLDVGFFAFDGARFASLLPTGVLVLVGWAVGAVAITGAVGAQFAAAAKGGAQCRGGKTWVALLAFGCIVFCCSSKPCWAFFTALAKRARTASDAFGGTAALRRPPGWAIYATRRSAFVTKVSIFSTRFTFNGTSNIVEFTGTAVNTCCLPKRRLRVPTWALFARWHV